VRKSTPAHPAHHGQPIEFRQLAVENEGVIDALQRHPQRCEAVAYAIDNVAALAQPLDEIVRRPAVVFGHQHAHARSPVAKRDFISERWGFCLKGANLQAVKRAMGPLVQGPQ